MQPAPPVRLTLLPSASWRWAQSALGATAGASSGLWVVSTNFWPTGTVTPDGSSGAAALGVWALLAGGALLGGGMLWLWAREPALELDWDGKLWRCRAVSPNAEAVLQPCQVRVIWDLGSAILLRVAVAGRLGPRWTMARRTALAAAWHPLRLALYAGRP